MRRYLRAVYLGLGLGGTIAAIFAILFLAGVIEDWLSPDIGPRLQRHRSYEAPPAREETARGAPPAELARCVDVVGREVPGSRPEKGLGLTLPGGDEEVAAPAPPALTEAEIDWWNGLRERGLVAEGDRLVLGIREIEPAPWGATASGTLDRAGAFHLRVDPHPEPIGERIRRWAELGGEAGLEVVTLTTPRGSGGFAGVYGQALRLGPFRLIGRAGLEVVDGETGWRGEVGVRVPLKKMGR